MPCTTSEASRSPCCAITSISDPRRCIVSRRAPDSVSISRNPSPSDPVIYLSQDAPSDYRIFVQSRIFSARDAAALIVGARGGHRRLEAASL